LIEKEKKEKKLEKNKKYISRHAPITQNNKEDKAPATHLPRSVHQIG